MKKTIIMFTMFFICLKVYYASGTEVCRIGEVYYDTLENAISKVKSDETIVLISNINSNNSFIIDKPVNIDLNNHNISVPRMVFKVDGGQLKLVGSGVVKELEPYYGAVVIKGSLDENKVNFSLLEVDEDITLEGWSGVFIDQNSGKGYGIKVIVNGIINAVDDISGSNGIGVYVNGNIKDTVNSPTIIVNDSSNIFSTGVGIYQAGYAKTTIYGGYIEGVNSAIAIKSGVLNINDGEFVCNGNDNTPTSGINNGVNASGTTLQIESNPSYAGKIEIDIINGIFKSKYSNVIYEYLTGSVTNVYNFIIKGGTYISESSKDVFNLSLDFKNKIPSFIIGGKFSSDPTAYLKVDYRAIKNTNDLFEVSKTTSSLVSKEVSNRNDNIPIIVSIIIICSVLFIVIFFINNGIKFV